MPSLTLRSSQATLANVKLDYEYRHIFLPLSLGYQIRQNKLLFIPEAGFDLAYNFGLKSTLVSAGYKTAFYSQREDFARIYNDLSVLGTARFEIGYQISNSVLITGGPSLKYMLTNLVDKNAVSATDAMQKNHTLLMNAGLYIGLSK